MRVVWSPGSVAPVHGLRYLALLALAAPIVAAVRRKRIEICLLFAMPLVYLLLLIAVHIRAPHIFATRYLFPVVPVCCLFAGAMFYFLGLEEKPWRELLEPRVLVPMLLACAILLLVVNPARAENFEPSWATGEVAAWVGWLALAVVTAPLVRWRAQRALMVILLLALFGPGFNRVYQSLAHRYVAQRGDVILYPWTAFRSELAAVRPTRLAVEGDLWQSYRMVGKPVTRQLIARVFFRREDLAVEQIRRGVPDTDRAIVKASTLQEWQARYPGSKVQGIPDRSGSLVLVEPRHFQQSTLD